MPNTATQRHASTRAITRPQALYIALAAAVITALVFSPVGDQGFFAIVFLGPILTGVAARRLDRSWNLAAAPWALSGVFFLAYDGLVNSEDVAFHVALTLMMVVLTALGALIGRVVWRLAPRSRNARA